MNRPDNAGGTDETDRPDQPGMTDNGNRPDDNIGTFSNAPGVDFSSTLHQAETGERGGSGAENDTTRNDSDNKDNV